MKLRRLQVTGDARGEADEALRIDLTVGNTDPGPVVEDNAVGLATWTARDAGDRPVSLDAELALARLRGLVARRRDGLAVDDHSCVGKVCGLQSAACGDRPSHEIPEGAHDSVWRSLHARAVGEQKAVHLTATATNQPLDLRVERHLWM